MAMLSDERIAKWRCDACGQASLRRTTIPFERELSHDGRPPVKIVIPNLPVIACTNPACPPEHPDHTVIEDDETLRRIDEETCRQLGLLTPKEIREQRERLGLTQQQMQDLLGLGKNTISRWETGAVYHARSMDTFLRTVFGVPEALAFVQRLRSSDSAERPNADRFPYLTASAESQRTPPNRGAPKLRLAPSEFFAHAA